MTSIGRSSGDGRDREGGSAHNVGHQQSPKEGNASISSTTTIAEGSRKRMVSAEGAVTVAQPPRVFVSTARPPRRPHLAQQ